MKRVISIVCVAVLIVSMLALAGCGMDGTYVGMQSGNKGDVLIIKGNTLTYTEGGDDTAIGIIDKKSKTITIDGDVFSYQISGKNLTVFSGSDSMVFVKQ